MVNGLRSGVAIRSRETRVARSARMITRRKPSGLSSMIRPGLARSARSAESTAALGPGRLGRIPGQRDAQRPRGHVHVVELDQRRLSALGALADAEHLLVVHPAVAMLDQLDGGPIQLHPAQHHLAGDQVRQPIGDPRREADRPAGRRWCRAPPDLPA